MSQEITLDRLQKLIKAYDVRGIVPGELDENISFQIGQAFVVALKLRKSEGGCGQVVIAHDMRPSGPALVQSFANGIKAQGVDAGAMFTASHNPAQYNGIKLAKAGAAPVGQDSGLKEITQLVLKGVSPYEGVKGKDSERDLNSEYVKYLHSLVDLKAVRKLKVVIDAGNGMGGFSVPKVFDNSNIEIVPMYFELDGTFPNHEANPIEPANLVDLQKRVVAEKADLGIAFDGDADRAFFVDENGVSISPSAITALIAKRELKREPGSVIIHNLITSRSVAEVVSENGGTAIKTRVGHSFIKQVMKDTNAIFGGEHSGHFYFRDFWFADSGMLAALHVLSALGETKSGETFSALIKEFDRYIASGEINTRVKDVLVTSNKVRQHFALMKDVQIDDLDGLTFASDAWWVNIRPSNTEPLLRLNAEAKDRATMEKLRDEVLVIIRKDQQ
jgi:phosphomannomutase